MRTGDVCERKGTYQAFCCKACVDVTTGDKIPLCPTCGKPAVFSMVRAPK